eukprot:g1811.t1
MRSILYPDVNVYAARKRAGLPGAVHPRPNPWTPRDATPGRALSRTALAASGSQSLLASNSDRSLSSTRSRTKLSASRSELALRTIHGTMLRTRVPKEPWKRKNAVPKDPYLCPGLGRKVSKPPEAVYHAHKDNIKREQGANFKSPFFKTHISAENPSWMHIRELEPDMYLKYKEREKNELARKNRYKIAKQNAAEGRDAVSSYESPAWFRTNKNGKAPLKHLRSMPYGNRTLPVYDSLPGAKAGLSMQENRTARHEAMIRGPHNRIRTEMVEFVRASVKQGVKPFER